MPVTKFFNEDFILLTKFYTDFFLPIRYAFLNDLLCKIAVLQTSRTILMWVVVAYTCNTATLEAEFWNSASSVPAGSESRPIGGLCGHLTKYWEGAEI